MSKGDGSGHRARYALEFKLKAARLVSAGQDASVMACVLGAPKPTLRKWNNWPTRVCCKAVVSAL